MVNRNRNRAGVGTFGFGLVAALGFVTAPLVAQEPPSEKAPAAAGATTAAVTRGNPLTRRVPPFFGQLGLTPEQKEEIYKVRSKHQERIDALRKQIDQAQAEMLADCEKVLNPDQRKLLASRRDASARKGKSGAAAGPAH